MDLVGEIDRFQGDLAISAALTPPDSWYTTEPFLVLERDRVFMGNWICVGRADQVASPGDYFTGSLIKLPYVVTRTGAGELKAFFNVCRHHGTCLVRGEGRTEQLVCPYHGWTYSLDGQLKKAPRAGAIPSARKGQLNLHPIHVDQWGIFIWICVGPPRQSLASQLAGLEQSFPLERLDGLYFIRRISYEIPCNWKVYVDNYLDGGYHVPHMHPALATSLDLKTYKNQLGSYWSVQSCASARPADRLGAGALYSWIYPNFMLNRYGAWLDTNTVIPLSTNRCLTVFDYFHEREPEPDILEKALADSDRVQQEDIQICHMVQAGLESGAYQQGVYASKFEEPMFHFHRLLAADFRS